MDAGKATIALFWLCRLPIKREREDVNGLTIDCMIKKSAKRFVQTRVNFSCTWSRGDTRH